MSGILSHASKPVNLSHDLQGRDLTEFPVTFKIGPYYLSSTTVDLTVMTTCSLVNLLI